MMTRVSVKNYAGKRVFFYHCNGRFAWGHILKVEIEADLKAWAVDRETHTINVERR